MSDYSERLDACTKMMDSALAMADAVNRRMDAFNEGDHPRAEDGKFGSGGGGGKSKGGASASEHKSLTKAGYTKTSEPGTDTYKHPTAGPGGGPSTVRYQTRDRDKEEQAKMNEQDWKAEKKQQR